MMAILVVRLCMIRSIIWLTDATFESARRVISQKIVPNKKKKM